ncbi:hypothetical protein M407DRAFT_233445 [Tulasnella calospora MUT 4182]|uniref:Uracil-DNA glycosylase-like domain-containing protein n=1 Tax=Tulasnella calospora MUT 4182 TaxID=1051891 RepID=A0A0C3QAB4_9AGAM|nr:hypothetical protein M407DRAFT_233445 [Tulasnella calospora MUT 4182]
MRASLAKFSFRGASTTPPKSKVAGTTLSQPVQATTATKGVKRKLSELLPDSDSQRPTEARRPTPGKSSSSSRQGTPGARKKNPGYAPPETYAHLNYLEDYVKPNLDSSPGTRSATVGHHFAHPTNQFYRALHKSGLTDTLLDPSEDWSMPERYNLGLTNMVDRPSLTASELSRAEKIAGVPTLLRKVARYRPRIVCFIGREIGDAFETAVRQSLKTSGFGLLPYKLVYPRAEPFVLETLFFTAPSTSGRVQSYQLEDRVQLLRVLREEKEAVLSGSADTSEMTIIPPALYEIDESRTKSRFFIRHGSPTAV